MPHIDIKHYPIELAEQKKAHLIKEITTIITQTFSCSEEVVSITIQPIEPNQWTETVYEKEIIPKKKWLVKKPEYKPLSKQ